MQKTSILKCLTVVLCLSNNLMAEIETVRIKWTPSLCRLESCIKGLEQQFRRVRGVADVEIDQPGGQTILRWRPDVQFTYPAVYTAMAMIGLSVDDIHLRVRGRIVHDAQNVFLISTGDETRFQLFGPIQAKQLEYNVQYNVIVHPLPDDIRARLLEAEKTRKNVLIEGPLLMPERSPPDPLQLIVERLDVTQAPAPS